MVGQAFQPDPLLPVRLESLTSGWILGGAQSLQVFPKVPAADNDLDFRDSRSGPNQDLSLLEPRQARPGKPKKLPSMRESNLGL
jgi:hypothetical protein